MALRVTGQGGGQIEAKTIHAVVLCPVAQGADDKLEHPRLGQIDAVAATGPVLIARLVVRLQVVVACVGQAAQRQAGAVVVELGRVVEDHIEH